MRRPDGFLAGGVLVGAVALLLGAGGATAAQLITGAQIENGSVTGKDVRNKSLSRADFRGSVQGERGPQGERGASGPAGPQGSPGPIPLRVVRWPDPVTGPTVTVAPGETSDFESRCPPARRTAVSGGYVAVGGTPLVRAEGPVPSLTGWFVQVENTHPSETMQVTLTTVCVEVT